MSHTMIYVKLPSLYWSLVLHRTCCQAAGFDCSLVCLRDPWNKKKKKKKLQGFVISQNRKNKKNNVFKWFGDLDYWESFQTLRIQWFWSLSTLHNHPNHCIRKVWRLSNHSNLAWSPTAYYFNDLQMKMISFQLRINWIMSFRAPDWTRINFDQFSTKNQLNNEL